MKVFAVYHSLGCSLFSANTPEGALRKARIRFGTYGGPYTLPENQEQEIASAKAFGAFVQ